MATASFGGLSYLVSVAAYEKEEKKMTSGALHICFIMPHYMWVPLTETAFQNIVGVDLLRYSKMVKMFVMVIDTIYLIVVD